MVGEYTGGGNTMAGAIQWWGQDNGGLGDLTCVFRMSRTGTAPNEAEVGERQATAVP